MNTQPEALRLADLLDRDDAAHHEDAAAELRRLHEVNQSLINELHNIVNAKTWDWDDPSDFKEWAQNRARAALARATGENT